MTVIAEGDAGSSTPAPAPTSTAPAGVLGMVAELEALVDALTAAPAWEQSSAAEAPVLAEASVRVGVAMGRLRAQRSGWLAVVEADGRWATQSARTFAHWLAWTHGMSVSAARGEVNAARALRDDLPLTAEAARAGRITPEHVATLVKVAASSAGRRAALAGPVPASEGRPYASEAVDGPVERGPDGPQAGVTGERVLVDLAGQHRPEPFRRIANHFAALADPDAADRAFRDAADREHLDLAATLGGFHVTGFLTAEHGQAVRTALEAAMGVPAAGDVRTPGQRRAQGLVDLTRTALDHGLVGTGSAVRPHLTVTVSWTELTTLLNHDRADHADATLAPAADPSPETAGRDWAHLLARPPAAFVDSTGPIDPAVLRRLACDSELTRIIFGPDNTILNVGRRERTVTGARRQAVIARDKHCVYGHCDAPPARCEIHHALQHWADGGHTSTDCCALLCWYHHDYVDTHHITMTRTGGRWHFHHPNGTRITFPDPVPTPPTQHPAAHAASLTPAASLSLTAATVDAAPVADAALAATATSAPSTAPAARCAVLTTERAATGTTAVGTTAAGTTADEIVQATASAATALDPDVATTGGAAPDGADDTVAGCPAGVAAGTIPEPVAAAAERVGGEPTGAGPPASRAPDCRPPDAAPADDHAGAPGPTAADAPGPPAAADAPEPTAADAPGPTAAGDPPGPATAADAVSAADDRATWSPLERAIAYALVA